jgi:predicted DNA-binding transcriptional regulator YafY
MTRTERLLSLIQLLRRHRRPVTGRTVADELGVSLRTVYRDIATLIAQGAPIEGEAGVGFLLRPGFLLPPLMFRDEEIEALVLGSRWVSQLPDATLSRAAQDALAKIHSVLPSALRERAEYSGLFPVPRAAVLHDTVDGAVLRRAIREERKLRLAYRDEAGLQTTRVVWPLAIGFYERLRVLVAWCELRTAFRHFRTDRIEQVVEIDQPLPRGRQALLEEWRLSDAVRTDPGQAHAADRN